MRVEKVERRQPLIYKPREPLPETQLARTSTWDHEKINFCCLIHPVSNILLWQSKQTKIMNNRMRMGGKGEASILGD